MPRRDMMMGPGGRLVRPLSESDEIARTVDLLHGAMAILEDDATSETRRAIRQLQMAVTRLQRLGNQVEQGYHRNPYKPLRMVGTIGEDVHMIAYRHAKDGKLYKHDFQEGSAKVYAIERHGKRDLLISGDVPLWDDF